MTIAADDTEKLKALVGLTFATLQKLSQQFERQLGTINGGVTLLNTTRPRRTLALALHAVTSRPDATASELALAMGETESRHIGRRLSDLARQGTVTKGAVRVCSVTGRKAAVWSLTPVPVMRPVSIAGGLGSSVTGLGGSATITAGSGGIANPAPISPPNNQWSFPGVIGSTSLVSLTPSAVPVALAPKPTAEAVIDKMTRGEMLSSSEYQILKQFYQKL